jgi:hypothetical protein
VLLEIEKKKEVFIIPIVPNIAPDMQYSQIKEVDFLRLFTLSLLQGLDFSIHYIILPKNIGWLMLNVCSLAFIVWFMIETDYLVEWLAIVMSEQQQVTTAQSESTISCLCSFV